MQRQSRNLASLVIAALLGVAAPAYAVPATVSFSGRLTTANGPVTGNVALTFTLYTQAIGGTAVWSESRPNAVADDGLVYADLGALTTLDESVLGDGPLFLEVVVGAETLSPRLPLQSVPYAIRAAAANRADTLGGITAGEVVTAVNGGSGIIATRSGNTVTLGASTAAWQARVTGACAAGSSIASISATGGVTCEPDTDTNTTYSAAATGGLALNGTAFGLASCPSGQVMKAGASGAWACGADAGATYTAPAAGGLAINASNQISLAPCASGAVLRMGATGSWTCTADLAGVTAGSGLTGGGTSGSVGLAIANGGVGAAHLATGAVTMDKTDGPVGYLRVSGPSTPTFPAFVRAVEIMPSSSGFCTVSVVGNTTEASPTGWAAVAGGLRVVGAGVPSRLGDLFTSMPGVQLHSASGTQGYPVTAGTRYEIGCIVNVQNGSSFADNQFSCDVAWTCS